MNTQQGLKILKEEGIFWSRLGLSVDPPQFDENNNNILNEPPEQYFKYHRDMAKAGVKVHTCIVPSGWISSGEFNFKTAMYIVDRLMTENPDIYFMPRIKLNPPASWMKENPEEVCVYEGGPGSKEAIAGFVGSEKQDLIGIEKDGTVISNQSLSSLKWRNDAKEYLNKLIDIIEQRSYNERIIGYHLGYGRCGETHIWGTDFGISEKKHFYEFGLSKYKNTEILKEKWNMSTENAYDVPIPKRSETAVCTNNTEEFFHIGDRYISYIDYNLYRKEITFKTAEDFARIVKEKTNKAVGFFHGYIMTDSADRHGHTDLDEVLNSPYIDFLCAPKSYYRNSLGEPGGYYAPPLSINMKKLWFDETDYPNNGNSDEFIKVLWREYAKNLSMSTPFWWMDLLGSWYDDRNVISAVKRMIDIKKKLPSFGESIAEILLVTDENTAIYTMQNHTFYTKIIQEAQAQTALSGMPYDLYRMCDLESIDLKKYKMIIFLNCFELSEKRRNWLYKNIKEGAVLVFNYTFGIKDEDFSLENVEKSTGFKLKKRPEKSTVPYFEIEKNDNIKPIYSFFDVAEAEKNNLNCSFRDIPKVDSIAVAELTRHDGGVNIMATVPSLTSKFIRETAEHAGCRIYAPHDTVVYGDSRFLGIFAHGNISGYKIENRGDYDAVKKEAVHDKMSLNMKKGDFVFLVKKEIMQNGEKV